ncbi:hypothetical protein QBC45DRAFT_165527 [Copromyces sp. CBS 386.78]|nr:hypothetical protein QBC45DRAFT_165527 [Copromyces sp. CBS 386.78]
MAWPAATPKWTPWRWMSPLPVGVEAKDGDNQPIKPRAHNHREVAEKEPEKRKDCAITRCNVIFRAEKILPRWMRDIRGPGPEVVPPAPQQHRRTPDGLSHHSLRVTPYSPSQFNYARHFVIPKATSSFRPNWMPIRVPLPLQEARLRRHLAFVLWHLNALSHSRIAMADAEPGREGICDPIPGSAVHPCPKIQLPPTGSSRLHTPTRSWSGLDLTRR